MAYLAGAWLIVQVADTVIPWLGLSDAVGRILLIVLIVGFIPAVIATWLFEWTPDGIRFDDEVEVDAAGAVVARRRLDRIIIGILALAEWQTWCSPRFRSRPVRSMTLYYLFSTHSDGGMATLALSRDSLRRGACGRKIGRSFNGLGIRTHGIQVRQPV